MPQTDQGHTASELLAQLAYSLLANSVPTGDRAAQARTLRRVSEAYNLR